MRRYAMVSVVIACFVLFYAQGVFGQTYRVTTLPILDGTRSWATSINDYGQIVGSADDRFFHYHPCLWQDGSLTDLSAIITQTAAPNGISNRGQIVGGRLYLWFRQAIFMARWDIYVS